MRQDGSREEWQSPDHQQRCPVSGVVYELGAPRADLVYVFLSHIITDLLIWADGMAYFWIRRYGHHTYRGKYTALPRRYTMKGRLEKMWTLREKGSFISLFLRVKETEHLCKQKRIRGKKGTDGGHNHRGKLNKLSHKPRWALGRRTCTPFSEKEEKRKK